MELNGLVGLQVLLAEENVEVGVLLDRDIDLVGVLWAAARSGRECLAGLSFAAFLHVQLLN